MSHQPGLNLHNLLVFRHHDLRLGFHAAQGFREGERLRFFAVDDTDLFEVAGNSFDVMTQFVLIRVAGERINGRDLRADFVWLAENVDRVLFRQDLRAQRVFRAVTDK